MLKENIMNSLCIDMCVYWVLMIKSILMFFIVNYEMPEHSANSLKIIGIHAELLNIHSVDPDISEYFKMQRVFVNEKE